MPNNNRESKKSPQWKTFPKRKRKVEITRQKVWKCVPAPRQTTALTKGKPINAANVERVKKVNLNPNKQIYLCNRKYLQMNLHFFWRATRL